MESLFISQNASSSVRVSIENSIYYVDLNFSTREQSWYFTLKDVNRFDLVSGVKLQWGTSPTLNLVEKPFSGNFYVIRNNTTLEPIGRNNLSQTGDYSLVYVSLLEEIEFQLVEA